MTESVDTYVLPEDSNKYLSEVLPTSNPLRITWEVLTDEEKAEYLSAALRCIENLTFIGTKTYRGQPLKFPRIRIASGSLYDHHRAMRFGSVAFDCKKIPDEVKRAQVYWAAELVREELYVKRRNEDACISLGLIKAERFAKADVPKKVKELLHNWITNMRRI